MKNTLKVWLRRLEVTADPNDFFAVMSYMGRASMKTVIDAMMAGRNPVYRRRQIAQSPARSNIRSGVNGGLMQALRRHSQQCEDSIHSSVKTVFTVA